MFSGGVDVISDGSIFQAIFEKIRIIQLQNYKHLEPGLSPQSWLNFQGFWGSKLLNSCLVVAPSNICLRAIQ